MPDASVVLGLIEKALSRTATDEKIEESDPVVRDVIMLVKQTAGLQARVEFTESFETQQLRIVQLEEALKVADAELKVFCEGHESAVRVQPLLERIQILLKK